MSQISQSSEASTIPYQYGVPELDSDFLEELTVVEHLYEEHSEAFSFDNYDFSDVDSDDGDDDDLFVNHNAHVTVDKSSLDIAEDEKIATFLNESCGCKDIHGVPCSTQIDVTKLIEYRQQCTEMSTSERDMVIKSQLFAHRLTGGFTQGLRKKVKTRERASQEYFFMGVRICRSLFCFAHNISKSVLLSVSKSLDAEGMVPRTHGNKNKVPANSLTFEQRQQIKKFILEYATENALPLPGRLPNVPNKTVLLLPSDKKVVDIYNLFNESASKSGFRTVCLKTFRNSWSSLCPHITIAKPDTDLCHKCQKFCTALNEAGKVSDEEKQEILMEYSSHVTKSRTQRAHYRAQTFESQQVYMNSNPTEGSPPCSLDTEYHYSWDFAQQVHYPHHSQQVGPIYFRTPRKCHVFGICAEGSGKQTFYLIDEGQCTGKGSESVISMAHHYWQYYGIGEKHVQIHFDNATGQNKNNLVIWYAMWRTLTGLHESVSLSMMLAGHTKFAPDWHFGIWKVKWRDSNVETLAGVAESVRLSSRGGHNIPQLLDDSEKPVPFFKWKIFLERYFRPVKSLTKYHHFFVCSSEPGIVTCKEYCDSDEIKINILKNMPEKDSLPDIKEFPGLDAARQWYLYEQIGQFFRSDSARDIVCPKPVIPKVEIKLSDECDVKKGGKRKKNLLS